MIQRDDARLAPSHPAVGLEAKNATTISQDYRVLRIRTSLIMRKRIEVSTFKPFDSPETICA